MRIRFVTSNQWKFNEISEACRRKGIEVEWVRMKYEEIQADDTEEIARTSCERVSAQLGSGFFLEDTGLYVGALGGFPGPYSSYVSKTIGNAGLLKLLEGKERGAYFLTVIAYFDGTVVRTFRGILEGTIADAPRGSNGFGFDPVFIPSGHSRTLAEMSTSEKNMISHRSSALSRFLEYLAGRGNGKAVHGQ
ncbi:non-canonical purine NTP pyrophosphatase [Thermogymnomonas acidicola]|uniref:dITP/XTP pyrophosphatase n=1 Tax=Thermogymnomonas acidicola TaxID=399579 RepID=A0AA37BPX6_9ARCH|nr:XTP/dITP diphosphatase [Thermogymnomonas acidicola]GGM67389.1 non-canonical purine NTP pyrophosphatase [Thermogymnomonas acidicola]